MGSGFRCMSLDTTGLWDNSSIHIGNGAGVGGTKIGFGVERVPGPLPVM